MTTTQHRPLKIYFLLEKKKKKSKATRESKKEAKGEQDNKQNNKQKRRQAQPAATESQRNTGTNTSRDTHTPKQQKTGKKQRQQSHGVPNRLVAVDEATCTDYMAFSWMDRGEIVRKS